MGESKPRPASVRYRLSPSVVVEPLGRRCLVLQADGGEYFELNETGTVVLNALVETGRKQDAVVSVMQVFDVADDPARADVDALIVELEMVGVLVRIPL